MMERSFKEAYGVLQHHAKTLRDQSEPNIDDLLKIVQESVQAYGVCKKRIDAVELALKAALDGADGGAAVPVALPSVAAVPVPASATSYSRTIARPFVPAPKPASRPSRDAMDDIDEIPF